MAVDGDDVGHPGDPRERRHRARHPHLHRPATASQEGADLLERDEAPMPDDRDAVADPLHLREDVGGEEDGPPRGAELVEDLVEGPLHQRIEALRRLVEDRQLRVVLEGLHDPQLLAHAPAVVAHGPAEVAWAEIQAVEEPRRGARAAGRRTTPGSPAGRSRSWCRRARSRRAGSRPGPESPRRRPACRGRAPGPIPRSGGGTRGGGGCRCSCRHRWDPGTRRSRRHARSARRRRAPGPPRRHARGRTAAGRSARSASSAPPSRSRPRREATPVDRRRPDRA